MRNDDLADHGVDQRGEAEQADQIAALIEFFESLEKNLNPLVECTDVPPNSTRAKVKRFYKLLKIVKMGGQDINPRFQFAFALIAVALGAVKCGLLIYVLLGDMPWSIFFLYVILIAFSFIAN